MAFLPTTLLEHTGLAVLGGVCYFAKKALDVAAEVYKARLLEEQPKRYMCIYAPDGSVVKRVEVDSQ